jgi:hypothetical protein
MIRYLDGLPIGDPPQQFAGPLPEFPNANRRHVLLVAHKRGTTDWAEVVLAEGMK